MGHAIRHQPVAGIGHQRHARIAHQSNGLPFAQGTQNGGPHLRRVMFMIGHEPRADAVALQKLGRGAGVLAQEDINCGHGG